MAAEAGRKTNLQPLLQPLNEPPATSKQASDPHHYQHGDLRWVFQFIGLVFVLSAVARFSSYRASRDATTRFDYRALAEGLRVQVYWILAGLNKSVPASYLHRQRGEMDWFRRAISSMTAPYDRWTSWFNELEIAHRVKILEFVTQKWVISQYEYHKTVVPEQNSRMHFHQITKPT